MHTYTQKDWQCEWITWPVDDTIFNIWFILIYPYLSVTETKKLRRIQLHCTAASTKHSKNIWTRIRNHNTETNPLCFCYDTWYKTVHPGYQTLLHLFGSKVLQIHCITISDTVYLTLTHPSKSLNFGVPITSMSTGV